MTSRRSLGRERRPDEFLLDQGPGPPSVRLGMFHSFLLIAPALARPGVLSAAFLLSLCSMSLQAFGLNPLKNSRQYLLRTWNSGQGLPQDSVRCILQASGGLLWVGTQSGLASYDGANFVRYESDNVPGESITGLAEDRDRDLWISSNGGLTRYRAGRFQTFTHRDGLPEDSIWRIASDPAGGIWAATWSSRVFHFDGHTVRSYTLPLPSYAREINALLDDPSGTLWVATFAGLFRFDGSQGFQKLSRRDGLAGDRIYALSLDTHHQLWAAGDGGLSRLVDGRFQAIPLDGVRSATLLAFDPTNGSDTVWTGSTLDGLFRVQAGRTERLRTADNLAKDEIYLSYFSRDGSLWLGTTKGLSQLSDGAISSYSTDDTFPAAALSADQKRDNPTALILGYGRGVLAVQNGFLVTLGLPKRVRLNPGSPPGGNSPVGLMTVGSVWVRTASHGTQGLILYTSEAGEGLRSTSHPRPPNVTWSSVDTALVDKQGTLWAGGSDIGVIAYGRESRPRAFSTGSGLDDAAVSVLSEDPSGDIWVGTLTGLNRIRDGQVLRIAPCPRVTSIYPATDGGVWAGCDSGLLYVAPSVSEVRLFTRQEGLPSNLIQGVTEDAFGYLWLGTERGIVRLAKRDLLASSSGNKLLSIAFGVRDGLPNSNILKNTVFRSGDGDIWCMTFGHLTVAHPAAIGAEPLAPVQVEQASVDDQNNVFSPTSLTVPAGRHRLTVRYVLPEFTMAGRLRFRYKLGNWDPDWIYAGSAREATYTGIPAGHYNFAVESSDGYGRWRSSEAALPITVQPPFFFTGRFYAIAAALLICCFWIRQRVRVGQVSAAMDQRLQERVRERTRIARELHDTLLQGVLGVAMEMYAASQQAKGSAALSALEDASGKLREIAEQSRKAVEDLRSPSHVLDTFEQSILEAAQVAQLRPGIHFQIKSVGTAVKLRPLVQTEVALITREAFANAMRHSGASLVRIDIVYQPSHFLVTVTDNGRGLSPEARNSDAGHWGIKGMHERADALGGWVHLLPHVPSGTVVEICLPAKVAYSGAWSERGSPAVRRVSRKWILRLTRAFR